MADERVYHINTPEGNLLKVEIGISKDQWLDMLRRGCFTKPGIDAILMFMREPENKSTYYKLGKKYNISPNALTGMTNAFSKTALKEAGSIRIIGQDGNDVVWAGAMCEGRLGKHFEAKLRPELVEAMREYLIEQLLDAYRMRVLEGGLDNSHSKELYKWKLMTACKGKTGKELIDCMMQNEGNILGWRSKDNLKKLLASNPSGVVGSFAELSSAVEEFDSSFKRFKEKIDGISPEEKSGNERTASLYLACKNPQTHPIFKSDIYALFCKYLGYEPQGAGKKYSHYISILKTVIAKEKADAELMAKIESETHGLIQSELLNAQDVLWQTQAIMENSLVLGERFTWIPFYKEFAKKILAFKDDRTPLLDIIYGLGSKFTAYLHEDDGGHLTDIDPFTTIGLFNRSGDESRKVILTYLKDQLGIEAEIPQDFTAIPVLNAQMSMMFWGKRDENDIPTLWEVLAKALRNEPFEEDFERALKQRGIKWNITMGLFWAAPDTFLPLDQTTRDYLKSAYGITVPNFDKFSYSSYIALMDEIRMKMNDGVINEKTFCEISESAWLSTRDDRKFWLAGYSWGSDKSQLERFFNEGVWEGNGNEKTNALIETVKEGDIIILKSSFVKGPKNDCVPCLRVKGIGIVESSWEMLPDTNYRFHVDYIPVEDKEFDGKSFGAYRKTLHDCKNEEIINWVKQILENMDNMDMDAKKEQKASPYAEYINLLRSSRNLILTGAPGTGKTFMANKIAEEMGAMKKFVQFHPSYDYTDFVEGLRPVGEGFERRDGVFKAFCKEALQNLEDSKKQDYVFIIDEINRGELSKIFGELFFSIDPGYRSDKYADPSEIIKVDTQYQNLVEPDDPFAGGFYVPGNVFIIGTMNDIDRSVESMDFAIRRRFAWREVLASDSTGVLDTLPDDIRTNALTRMKAINKAISSDEIGLSSAFHVGAAYFTKLTELGNDFGKLWNYHLKGLIYEYFRGARNADSNLETIRKAYFNIADETPEDDSADSDN